MTQQQLRIAFMLQLQHPYGRHIRVFSGAQEFARQNGWESIIDEYADETLARADPENLPYDGVIARATQKLASCSHTLNIPVVNVWLSSPARKKLPTVNVDCYAIGRLRAEHLLERGFRRFGCAEFQDDLGHLREVEGFKETITKAGHSCESFTLNRSYDNNWNSWNKVRDMLDNWIHRLTPPVGIFMGDELLSQYLVQQCRRRQWSVPHDVAIMTDWEEDILSEYPPPQLTSIDPGYERIGFEAARLLGRMITDRTLSADSILLPPVGIVPRESTDFFAVEDRLVAEALQYISSHAHEPIDIKKVAAAVDSSPSTLYRRFQQQMGHPVATEIRRLRIARAQRLLTEQDHSISDIAREVGFVESKRMHEVFVRDVGLSPTEYRRQQKARSSPGAQKSEATG